jgi:hypothetical protein
MSHALADVVHAEQFHLGYGVTSGLQYLCCPADSGCLWAGEIGKNATIGDQLALARAHIAEAHTAAPPDELAAVLHAVEAVQGDAYPALIPEDVFRAKPDRWPLNRCERCGRTVRGPLLAIEPPGENRRWVGPGCFENYRRSVAHIPSPLPIEGETP